MSSPVTVSDQSPATSRRSATPSLPEIHEFLGCRTPQAWVEAALANQDIMLIDHKNCDLLSALQQRVGVNQ
ncbi:tRNA isopentenyl-2-thiomethyl-A-37 hydroxylase MiaE [Pseudomonas sp. PA27(2017)]|uniref:tRNA isopentenyl-2-thiomethyl-A-37 hydroxylase MiaE n=1 Tax=Pseudomonas sp. PA27(2017) TaxID=1932112 RepID=UPI003532417D